MSDTETVPTIDELRELRAVVLAENPGPGVFEDRWRTPAEWDYCEAMALYVDAMLDTPKPVQAEDCVKCKACEGEGIQWDVRCKPCKGTGWIDVVP